MTRVTPVWSIRFELWKFGRRQDRQSAVSVGQRGAPAGGRRPAREPSTLKVR